MRSDSARPLSPDTGTRRTLGDLPSPPRLPLVGHMLRLDSTRRHHQLDEWVEDHGPMYLFRQGPKNVVVVTDTVLQNEVLRGRPGPFRRMRTIETVFEEMGIASVFSIDGDEWGRQRKLVNKMLSTHHQRLFDSTLTHHIERLADHWRQAADDGRHVDVHEDLVRASLDIAVAFIFGRDIDSRRGRGKQIHGLLQDIFVTLSRRIHSIFPYWRYVKLPADRAVDRTVGEMIAILQGYVGDARQRLIDEPERANDPAHYLDALLTVRDADGRPVYADEAIVGNLLIMLLAGEDAVADVLTWVIYNVCGDPELQRRLQDEADHAATIDPRLESPAAIDAMPLVEAVVSESLRLHPADHALFMEAATDTELGGVLIPKGTVIFLLIRFTMRSDENFGEGERFHPDRWLAPRGCPHGGAHDRGAFVPFGSGRRGCPGRTFSYLEMKRVLAMISRTFEVRYAEPDPVVTEEWGILMTPRGLSVRFSHRDHRGSPVDAR